MSGKDSNPALAVKTGISLEGAAARHCGREQCS
jgi:hypothetical protein